MKEQTSKYLTHLRTITMLLSVTPQFRYWEANLKDRQPSESNIDMWIRAKYEQKRWAMKGPIPDPSTLGGEEQEVRTKQWQLVTRFAESVA